MEYPITLRFTSPYRNYKIFLVSPTQIMIEGRLVRRPGKVLEFRDFECTCKDPETIKLALECGQYGKDILAPEWEKTKMSQQAKKEEASVSKGKGSKKKKDTNRNVNDRGDVSSDNQ